MAKRKMQPSKEDCIVPGEADRGGGLQIALGSGCRRTSLLLLDTTKLKILTPKLKKVDGS
jgi:hypothetical protein